MSRDLNFVSRRQFLQTTAAATLAAATPALFAQTGDDAYRGFRVGIQSYSLRGYDVETALKHTQTLGLKFWEAYPKHLPMSSLPAKIAEQKALVAKYGVTVTGYGVLPFNTNETQARSQFEFAKAMGITSLSADPEKSKETFDLLDKLVAEYDVAIAIHNHGPGHRYDKISDVADIVKDRHPKIGACVDTGHYLRSDEDPAEAISRLGKRVFGVHLKDVKTVTNDGKSSKQFKILGEGDLNIVACLKALKAFDYQGTVALEYEENPENPLSDLEVCLKNLRAAAAKV
ncbi:MAG: sugar phosphate isomerase/epimerase [Planctomycetaceae bacterium]|nr:sugar phosphate isomerase/epimerase [Planctomycetaceae bacterium]